MDKERGMVYLVGAGPGDPELLTLKGSRILSKAQVLVYDRLASPEFLLRVPDGCEKIYVGKRSGCHSMKQEEINKVLVEQALKGKTVVRLKGGDPFVFGRGGEEILELERHGIPYEVVPGVTSAVAALSDAGIPVTHRKIAQSFHVITGHTAPEPGENSSFSGTSGQAVPFMEGGSGHCGLQMGNSSLAGAPERGASPKGADTLTDGYREYAKLPGTLIFLMGLSNLERIVEKLIENGKSPETPAAVVTDGTLPTAKCVRAPLFKLPGAVREAGLTPPGIIVVGEAAAFHMKQEKKGPLSGVSVAVTGTDAMYEKLKKRLSAAGAHVLRAAVSHVEPVNRDALYRAVRGIKEFSWVAFTSRNGVKLFFEAMKETGVDFRSLCAVRFAVIGRGTGEYLKSLGFSYDYMPKEYTTAALAAGLLSVTKLGEKILVPRAVQGSKVLNEIFLATGADFTDLPVYDIRTESLDMEAAPDYITFESGSGVRGYFKEQKEEKRKLLEGKTRAVCIGAVTAAALREYGDFSIVTAEDYTADGLLAAVLNDKKNG